MKATGIAGMFLANVGNSLSFPNENSGKLSPFVFVDQPVTFPVRSPQLPVLFSG